ncbi:MAG: hypothetical protein WC680_10095 [Sulfuricurvum sp.]|jgi:hypothetical protein
MKTVLLGVILFVSNALYSAQTHRMELLIADMLEMKDVQQCAVSSEYLGLMMANASVKISENDVIAWNPTESRLTLNPLKFSKNEVIKRLQGHCFYLRIDGKLITSGPILSQYSARLSKLPTMKVYSSAKGLDLQLVSGNSTNAKPIQNKSLDSVLRQR